jgi:transglutaminase-like putative cysteine protease
MTRDGATGGWRRGGGGSTAWAVAGALVGALLGATGCLAWPEPADARAAGAPPAASQPASSPAGAASQPASGPRPVWDGGRQAAPGPRTIALAAGLWRPREVDTVVATVLWVHANTRRPPDRALFLKRDAEELAAERTPTGCIDYTILTAALLRAAGLRAVFVHGVRVGPAGESRGQGHAFLQLTLDGEPYLLDPTKGLLYAGYDSRNPNLPDRYVIQFKGYDVWAQGIRTEDVLLGSMERFASRWRHGYQPPGYVVRRLLPPKRGKREPPAD